MQQEYPYTTLTAREFSKAYNEAYLRFYESVLLDFENGSSRPAEEQILSDVFSCAAEIATAKMMNKYWSGGIAYKASDVGFGFEVRSTKHKNGHLIISEDDDPNPPYLLCLIEEGSRVTDYRYILVGWMFGVDAQQEQFRKNEYQGSFWVPQSKLMPMESLKTRNKDRK